MKGKACSPHHAGWWLVWLGGLNWGLVGLFDWNLIEVVFGNWDWLVKLIYILMGVGALLMLNMKGCKMCKK